jgi:glycosyltransferase involved in cell wall biosynthesis
MRATDIAIDASRADSRVRTGTEWYSYELLRALVDLPDRPPLTLYHREERSDWPHGSNVRHRIIRTPRLWTHAGLSRAMLRDRPSALFVPSHVIPIVHPRASVVTVHDLGFLAEPDAHPRRSRTMLDLTTRWNARAARRIIAISSQTRDDLVRHYHVSSSKIRVVYSGVDHSRFRRMDLEAARRMTGIPGPFLFFLSTIQPRKNVERLVEAFEMLERDDLLLVIAGMSGWLSEPIERRISHSPRAGQIVRMGHVADDLVPALYNAAEAFVLPSLYEGFGMGVLEAMACGCPVVTSNGSSLPEVAGGAAILVNPRDPASIRDGIQAALAPRNRANLIASGLARAATFTWERCARESLATIIEATHAPR